ncbi:glycosyltransferase family 2 protein [Candidatus Woesearchaeota archaeon]|nr:glycosyltransferase family 2 protein [Candidatus Woesearchaeota archaeon]
MKKAVFAVIPARNEDKHISEVVRKTKKYVDKIIVVDDGSTDKTRKEAKKANAVVLSHIINLGKGAAVKTGCDYAIKEGAETIVIIDADAQHQAQDIPRFLKKLKGVDIVFGYRELDKNMPSLLKFGNWLINKTITFLYGIKIKDSQCGYRAFTKKAYKNLRWKATDYSMESEMIARMGNHNLKYAEIPIKTIYSDDYKGTTVLDGMKIIFNMLIWKLNNI